MRWTDSLTESINQPGSLEKSAGYPYTHIQYLSKDKYRMYRQRHIVLVLMYYCASEVCTVPGLCGGITTITVKTVYSLCYWEKKQTKQTYLDHKEVLLHLGNMRKGNCVMQKKKKGNSKVRYEERKCSGQTHLSIIPWSPCSHPPSPTSNYKEKKCLAFSLLRNTQALHQNSIWFGNETALVHFPMQTAQSSIASTHGGFA